MASESEIEAAAERYKANEYPTGRGLMDEVYEPITKSVDRVLLAQYAVDRLAADLAERDERARPIDAEWLESIGGWSHEHQGVTLRAWRTKNLSSGWGWSLRPNNAPTESVFTLRNRGHWLDLLRVLKGGA